MKTRPCHFLTAALLLSSLAPLTGETPPVPLTSAEAETTFQQARASMNGDGVPKDMKKAFALMQAAAEAGNADAMGGVGYFHSTGLIVGKDDRTACEWFRKGAEAGSAKSRLNLGKSLLDGKAGDAVSPDDTRVEGLAWIIKAADQGLPEARFTYGAILYYGDHGVPKDYLRAGTYLKLAADAGHADARNFLGSMYESGLGFPLDATEAARWYRLAALQGHAKAQGNLGRVLDPVSSDKTTRAEALAWLMLAAAQGEVAAEKLISDSKPGLDPGDLDAARLKSVELGKSIVR